MVKITVIWLSVKYQNFFSFQNVTYAYPPHAVNVPFISSHIKISRSSLEPNLSTWQFYFPCRLLFCMFFFNLMLNLILFSGNTSFNKKFLYYNVRNWFGFPRSWASVQRISILDAPIGKSVLDANFQLISFQ